MKNLAWLALAGLMTLAPVPAVAQSIAVPAQRLGKVILGAGTSGDGSSICSTAPTSTVCRTLADRAKDRLNVLDFGAKLDGSDDTAALQATRARAATDGVIEVPSGQWQRTADPTAGPSSPVLWRLTGNKYGASAGPVINLGKDTVESYFQGTKFFGRGTSSETVGPVVRIDGSLSHSPAGQGNRSTLEVNSKNGTAANPGLKPDGFLWGITSKLESWNLNNEATAIYAQAIKQYPGGGIFGFVSETHDNSGQSSASAGPVVSAEIDLTANGADNCTMPSYGCRIMLDMVIAQSPKVSGSAAANQVGTVMQIGARPGEGSIKTVFRSINATPLSDSVLDATGFVFGPQAVALKLAQGQAIALDARNNDGGYARTLRVETNVLRYQGANGEAFNVDDAGTLTTAGRVIAQAGVVEPMSGTPAGATAPCTTGQHAWDVNYEYRCVATNRWRRIAYASDWP